MENNSSLTFAVTYGRFNLPHPGHAHLVRKMLEEADHALVCLSSASSNNDLALRLDALSRVLDNDGVDMDRVSFFEEPGPFQAVEHVIEDPQTGLVNPEFQRKTTVVLGVDQTRLGERLRDDLGVKFVPNEIRVGSSTVVRHFLEVGDVEFVREIYYGDSELFDIIQDLRKEELARAKS